MSAAPSLEKGSIGECTLNTARAERVGFLKREIRTDSEQQRREGLRKCLPVNVTQHARTASLVMGLMTRSLPRCFVIRTMAEGLMTGSWTQHDTTVHEGRGRVACEGKCACVCVSACLHVAMDKPFGYWIKAGHVFLRSFFILVFFFFSFFYSISTKQMCCRYTQCIFWSLFWRKIDVINPVRR